MNSPERRLDISKSSEILLKAFNKSYYVLIFLRRIVGVVSPRLDSRHCRDNRN